MTATTATTLGEIRDRFHIANLVASQNAKWCSDYPGADPDTCRYCGRHWRKWSGSKLDGHARCIVDGGFKRWLRDLMRDPALTYPKIAEVIGVTPGIVRSWTFPIRIVKE